MNLKLSFINSNIDKLINNSIPKNIFMDLPSYSFGKNFYLMNDHNKIILAFYIENNTDQKQYILIFFLNYKYTNNINESLSLEEDQKMTLEFCIGDSIKENNILSIISKIKNGYLIIGLSFKDEHFQIILIDMQLRLFKKYISKLFFIPTKRKGIITVITDLFIYEKYAFIIFDFYYIIIFDLINLDIIPIVDLKNGPRNIKDNIPNYINIKQLYKKQYNKTIYLDFERFYSYCKYRNGSNINNCKDAYLYLTTKKDIKIIKFNIFKNNKITNFSKNVLKIIKMINKKQNKDINQVIFNFNNNELYFYLNFLATLQKYSKNKFLHENYFSQILFIINNKIVKNIFLNLKGKNGCITNLLLLNQNKFFGIYNTFLRYNFSTIKYLYFIENMDISEDNINETKTINYLIIHKLIKNNENDKNLNLNDYFLSLSNNYLIIYQFISIIILLLLYEEKITKNIIKIYITSNFIINNNNDFKFILNKFKQILFLLLKKKPLNPFNNDKKITYYNAKKRIIMEIRNNLMNINLNKNITLFESVLVLINSNFYNEKNIKEYSYKEIKFIKFIYFLISYYLNQILNEISFNNIINIKIYNLYNINDILYALDYLNIPFENIFKKFFIKEISLKVDAINKIKELFYILLTIKLINPDNNEKNKILVYFNEYNSMEKNNFVIDPILFLLYLQNDKEYKNISIVIKNNITNLIQELIEKKINEAKHNKYFRLIFLYYYYINNNENYKESFFGRKMIIMHLEKELSLLELEMIKIFKLLFNNKKNKYNLHSNISIKYKNNENKGNSLINLLKDKKIIIFKSEIMTNKFASLFSIINNVIDIFLFLLNEMMEEKYLNEVNLVELFLMKNINKMNNTYSYNNENNEKYYSKENMSKLFKIFSIYFWLFYSFFTFIEEMNNKNLSALELSKENILISLLHIYYYYKKKFPDEPPILQKEIIQYIKFFISYYNKNNINKDIISIKMKNILEVYMEKDILHTNFKEFFSVNKYNINSINSSNNSINLLNQEKEKNEIIEIFNNLKINDIQFEMYLKQFKLLFLNEDNNLVKCSNNFITNLNINIKRNKFINNGNIIYKKYNKLLKYTKFIELLSINISIANNITLNDIHLSKDNFIDYNPQILFSMRKSIEQLNNNNGFNNVLIDELNKYVEIIPKVNNYISENNTTILNYNTVYSFSNNVITENNNSIRNEDINIIIKEDNKDKYNSTMIKENRKKENNINIDKMFKSMNTDEFMKRIKNKNQFYICDYQEEDLKCKYLSLKLLNKFLSNKKMGIKYMIFKAIKALYYINTKNKIDNQINIIINENEEENK